MKVTDTKKTGYKGEYYASVEFAKMDGGYGEYKHTNQTTNDVRWEVVSQNNSGGYTVRDMSNKEYNAYKTTRLKVTKTEN